MTLRIIGPLGLSWGLLFFQWTRGYLSPTGRYWISDGAIDSSSTPTLSQVRARSTGSSPAIRPQHDSSQHRIQQLEVSSSVTRHYLSYIPSLWVTITLTCNITDPARRREEGMLRDGGEDDAGARGGAGGSPRRSPEDGGDVPIHAEPWRRTGFRFATSSVPYNWPYSIPYSCEYENYS
jgi:hypothetical protein